MCNIHPILVELLLKLQIILYDLKQCWINCHRKHWRLWLTEKTQDWSIQSQLSHDWSDCHVMINISLISVLSAWAMEGTRHYKKIIQWIEYFVCTSLNFIFENKIFAYKYWCAMCTYFMCKLKYELISTINL